MNTFASADIFKKYLAGMMASVISTSSCVAFTSHCIHMVIDRIVVFCPLLKFPWCDLIIASAALVASKQLLHMHIFNELFYFVLKSKHIALAIQYCPLSCLTLG